MAERRVLSRNKPLQLRGFYNSQSEPPPEFYDCENEPNHRTEVKDVSEIEKLGDEGNRLRKENARLEQELVERKVQIDNLKSENIKLKANIAVASFFGFSVLHLLH